MNEDRERETLEGCVRDGISDAVDVALDLFTLRESDGFGGMDALVDELESIAFDLRNDLDALNRISIEKEREWT